MVMDTSFILDSIYSEIFLKAADSTVNIFLCGSRSAGPDSIRTLLYEALRHYGKMNVLFPEWLFSDLLAKHEHDLLTLEHELADSVDMVIIPLEGTGTIAELGAFASLPTLRPRIIVVNDAKYKWQSSFISLGPIKLIRKEQPSNIMYYDTDNKGATVDRVVSRLKYMKKREQKSGLDNLFNLSRFMMFVIGIFQPVSKQSIRDILLGWNKQVKDHHIEPGLNILVKNEIVITDIKNYEEHFSLTEKGHNYVFENILLTLNKVKPFNKIRLRVINDRCKRRRRVNIEKEREKLLVVS
jgi:hypothetical protein